MRQWYLQWSKLRQLWLQTYLKCNIMMKTRMLNRFLTPERQFYSTISKMRVKRKMIIKTWIMARSGSSLPFRQSALSSSLSVSFWSFARQCAGSGIESNDAAKFRVKAVAESAGAALDATVTDKMDPIAKEVIEGLLWHTLITFHYRQFLRKVIIWKLHKRLCIQKAYMRTINL